VDLRRALDGSRYKSGRLRPGKAAQKLFRLHRDRMILTPEWRGWVVKPDAIVDPEGNQMPRNLLRNYQLMLIYFRDVAKRSVTADSNPERD
jgi:hypothetical protein